MKLFKKYYVVLLLILCLSSGIIYGSYALYTTGADFSNAVNIGTDITYKFDINNTESIGVSNNSNFRFKGSLTNTIGSTMNYKFYYKVEGASSGVTVKEVTDSTSSMKSSGTIANNATITPEFYITNTSGKNITVTVGVSFAYSGTTVVQESGTNWITQTITSSAAKTGNCTTTGIERGGCSVYYGNDDKWHSCGDDAGTDLAVSLKTLIKLGLSSNGVRTDFSSVATTDEGIYSAEDDYGTSYYFRGAVTNNYVKFAGIYWRIIRINGDGTIRMIYDGTSAHANGDNSADRQLSSTSVFNSSKDDNAYVGFMYGSTGQSGANAYANTHANTNSSTIKGVLDTWYNGLSSTNKGYIADSIFCGDRTVNSESGYTGNGTVKAKTSYGMHRLKSNKNPILICANKNDRYTVSDTAMGNGALTNPVGLITADEVAMAGAVFGIDNAAYYLHTGQKYWSISPYVFDGSNALVFFVGPDGWLDYRYSAVSNTKGVRPVVNLKSDITFTGGNGSQGSPWIVGTGNA